MSIVSTRRLNLYHNQAIKPHHEKRVSSAGGAHGFRYDSVGKKLYATNAEGTEEEIETGGGFSGDYDDLTNKPESLPASDVPAWAKAANKPAYTASEVGALPSDTTHLPGDVPTTRKINNKALSADITLTASDVGALASTTKIPTVTDTYSATSANAMSGKAVASAISGKVNKTAFALSGTTLTITM